MRTFKRSGQSLQSWFNAASGQVSLITWQKYNQWVFYENSCYEKLHFVIEDLKPKSDEVTLNSTVNWCHLKALFCHCVCSESINLVPRPRCFKRDYKKTLLDLSDDRLMLAYQSSFSVSKSRWRGRQERSDIFCYLDAGQNVSHDDLFAAVLWEILTEFWPKWRKQHGHK